MYSTYTLCTVQMYTSNVEIFLQVMTEYTPAVYKHCFRVVVVMVTSHASEELEEWAGIQWNPKVRPGGEVELLHFLGDLLINLVLKEVKEGTRLISLCTNTPHNQEHTNTVNCH